MPAPRPIAIVIEDDAEAADALGLVLSDWGADVVHGMDEKSLVRDIGRRAAAVNWIIADFHLGPRPNGVTLAGDLVREMPQARVLVLSGSFQGHATAAAQSAGFDMLSKPAPAAAIISWLERG